MNKKHIEKTGAETKSIGFDFQYYFFLWKLLTLNKGESVGLEVKDDVHTELKNDINIFFQIKHSIQKNAKGDIINMTFYDKDLWKTLYNWTKVISDEIDNRETVTSQIKFIDKSHFIIWSNKNDGGTNQILIKIDNLKNSKIEIEDFINDLQDFENNSNDAKIKFYINEILKLDIRVIKEFILKIHFDLGNNDIIIKCKEAIEAKMIDKNKIDEVFAKIDSRIKEDNFINIRSNQKIEISFDDFHNKYRKYFNNTRNGTLKIHPISESLPDKLEKQIFIKQLLEIKDIDSDDIELMAQFTRFKLKLENNITKWYTEGEITKEEIEEYRNNAFLKWQNKFRRIERKLDSDESLSLDLLNDLREINLSIDGQALTTELSNGEFYYLSNTPLIGWKKDWEKYKK